MNDLYIIVCSEYKNKKTYGIALTDAVDGETVILETIADISSDKTQIDRLVSLCNELQLDPVHLGDVIEDLLAGI